jgi:hypothetical protein
MGGECGRNARNVGVALSPLRLAIILGPIGSGTEDRMTNPGIRGDLYTLKVHKYQDTTPLS